MLMKLYHNKVNNLLSNIILNNDGSVRTSELINDRVIRNIDTNKLIESLLDKQDCYFISDLIIPDVEEICHISTNLLQLGSDYLDIYLDLVLDKISDKYNYKLSDTVSFSFERRRYMITIHEKTPHEKLLYENIYNLND